MEMLITKSDEEFIIKVAELALKMGLTSDRMTVLVVDCYTGQQWKGD